MSESFCEVSLGDYDGDEAQFYTERVVTARTSHQCYECQEPIAKGLRHHTVTRRSLRRRMLLLWISPIWTSRITDEY